MRNITALLLLALLSLPAAALAQTAEQVVDSIYGADLKRVALSSDSKDDLALADKMLADVRSGKINIDVAAILCNKGFDLAMKDPAGIETAIALMQELSSRKPAVKGDCLEKIADAREKPFRAASANVRMEPGEVFIDALIEAAEAHAKLGQNAQAGQFLERAVSAGTGFGSLRLSALRERQKVLTSMDNNNRTLTRLQDQIKEYPADHAARADMIRLCLLELDNPVEARKYLEEASTESLKTYLPLACAAPDSLPEAACMELGDWYRGMADGASPSGKVVAMKRARTYYGLYLQKHSAADMGRTKAVLSMEKIDEFLGGAETSLTLWADLLKPVLGQLDGSDRWTVKDGKARSTGKQMGRLDFAAPPEEGYELLVRFQRESGGSFGVAMPAVKNAAAATYNDRNDRRNPDSFDLDGPKGGPVVQMKIPSGEEYLIHATIIPQGKNVEITVSLNGRKTLQWKGDPADVKSPNWRGHDSRTIGLFTGGQMTLEAVRMRPLTGKTPAASASQPASAPKG